MLNINYIRRGKAWWGGWGREGERGERVSWKLRETRVRGMRKRVSSGDGKGRTRETWAKTFEQLHSPPPLLPSSRGSGWRIKKSFRKFISGTLPERKEGSNSGKGYYCILSSPHPSCSTPSPRDLQPRSYIVID